MEERQRVAPRPKTGHLEPAEVIGAHGSIGTLEPDLGALERTAAEEAVVHRAADGRRGVGPGRGRGPGVDRAGSERCEREKKGTDRAVERAHARHICRAPAPAARPASCLAGGRATGPVHLYTTPPFTTTATRRTAVRSSSGFPSSAMMSASSPGAIAPIRSAMPSEAAATELAETSAAIGLWPHSFTRRSEERRVGKECRSRWS